MIQEMFSKQNNKCAYGSAPVVEPSLQKLLPYAQQGNCTLAAQGQCSGVRATCQEKHAKQFNHTYQGLLKKTDTACPSSPSQTWVFYVTATLAAYLTSLFASYCALKDRFFHQCSHPNPHLAEMTPITFSF